MLRVFVLPVRRPDPDRLHVNARAPVIATFATTESFLARR